MTTTRTDLTPASAGLPGERQLLEWAAELCGDVLGAPPAATSVSGTDWEQVAADVLHDEAAAASSAASSAPSEAYSPTLVSAAKADDNSSDAGAKAKSLPRTTQATIGSVPVDKVRADFPILQERLGSGRQLVWFDNGATTQRLKQVVEQI